MGEIVALFSILFVFGTPVSIVFIVKYFRLKEKELALGGRQDPKLLEAANKERLLLESRIQNLETIVCSVDFELNQRLNRVAAEASAMGRWQLPPGASVPSAEFSAVSSELAATQADVKKPGYALGHLEPGAMVLGRYRVERELGRGGMGAVYLAHDTKVDERVALKVFATLAAADPALAAERFRREVQAARRITHPNVVRIHDLGEDGPLLFLSMEYIQGQTLSAMLRKAPLSIAEGLGILDAVAQGVAAAHAAGVIHRDIKPQNVIVGGRAVKVIDFGLATTTFLAGMTATGMILGTAEYMAPEQVRGKHCDARADVYGLGALSYHVFCGRPPFQGDTPIAVGFAHLSEMPEAPRRLRPEIPERVEQAILRALEKDSARRFEDAESFRKALIG